MSQTMPQPVPQFQEDNGRVAIPAEQPVPVPPKPPQQYTELPEYIDDGWTAKATIDPVKNMHRGLKFDYRPAGFFQRRKEERELAKVPREDGEAYDRKRCEQLKARLYSWSYDQLLTIEAIFNLHPVIFMRLENIMNGVEPADALVVERKN